VLELDYDHLLHLCTREEVADEVSITLWYLLEMEAVALLVSLPLPPLLVALPVPLVWSD